MKKPNRRTTKVNARRVRTWVNEYANYRHTVSEHRILEWIKLFAPKHRDLAARVLDCIDIITHDQIVAAYKSILRGLDGWNRDKRKRKGKWRFVAYSASAGESGDSMLQKFRHARRVPNRIGGTAARARRLLARRFPVWMRGKNVIMLGRQ